MNQPEANYATQANRSATRRPVYLGTPLDRAARDSLEVGNNSETQHSPNSQHSPLFAEIMGEIAAAQLNAAPRLHAAPLNTVDPSLQLASRIGARLEAAGVYPGTGNTGDLWQVLATVASIDLGAARALEPHLDALAILHQAGVSANLFGEHSLWGVFAAEGSATPLIATPPKAIRPIAIRPLAIRTEAIRTEATSAAASESWLLSGVKPWCSLAGSLEAALITAQVGTGERRLFAVDLRQPGITVLPGTWHARGLTEIPSGPVNFVDVAATPVGEPGWYLRRAGFDWGAIGVAACWFGGTVAVARALFDSAQQKADDFTFAQLGAVDVAIESARRALLESVAAIDAGSTASSSTGSAAGAAASTAPALLAARVRSTVVRSAEEVLLRVGHALGPAPLALDERHAKAVADLTLYIAQHHAERDDASLGRTLIGGAAPW